MTCGCRVLDEPRGSVVLTVVFSSMEPKLILCCRHWRASSTILCRGNRVFNIECILDFYFPIENDNFKLNRFLLYFKDS